MNAPDWVDKHSVNCYFCNALVDERDCLPADPFNGGDGGDMCPRCTKLKANPMQRLIAAAKAIMPHLNSDLIAHAVWETEIKELEAAIAAVEADWLENE